MRQLIELTKDFQVSRPVFKISMHAAHDRTINVNSDSPVHQYYPTPIEGDLLSEMICDQYYEVFNIEIGKFEVDGFAIAERTMSIIRGAFPDFLDKHLDMRSPTQSKVYRWYYRSLPDDSHLNDMLVILYKHIRTFCDKRMNSSNQAQITNTIALLHAIMEKYEK